MSSSVKIKTRNVLEVFYDEVFSDGLKNDLNRIRGMYDFLGSDYTDEKLNELLDTCLRFFNDMFGELYDHFCINLPASNEDQLRQKIRLYSEMWKRGVADIYNNYGELKKILELSNNKERQFLISENWIKTFETNMILLYINFCKKGPQETRNIFTILIDELIKQDKSVGTLLKKLAEKENLKL